jgi:hypothetical protein
MSTNGCLICDEYTDGFTYCPSCVVMCVIEGLNGDKEILDWLKVNKPERFQQLVAECRAAEKVEAANTDS